jgi:hypothetical protein
MAPSVLSNAFPIRLGEPPLALISLHGDGPADAAFVLGPKAIELRDLQGRSMWTVPIVADRAAHLVATGDFDGDGVTDGIFQILVTPTNPTRCGTSVVRTTRLLFISGATGAATWPLAPTEDLCWSGFGTSAPYVTHQWALGTAYVGPMTSSAAKEVVVFPYYATRGDVLHDSSSVWSPVVAGSVSNLTYPSSPAYDRTYDAANPQPCSGPTPGSPCYVSNSHVANAVFLDGTPGGGLFVLTSSRALVYGPDLLPHSDVTWLSGGRSDNSGRNYGLLERVPGRRGELVLIGGCGAVTARLSMFTGKPDTGLCAIHHHYEWFLVQGSRIARHASRYYSYTGTDGPWDGRIEYPLHASSGFAGAAGTILFNLYRQGQWRAVVMTDPSRPESAREFPGWYVWDTVELPNGTVDALASRVPAGGGDDSRVPPWQFDVVQWDGLGLTSRQHFDGLAPAMVPYAPTAGLHSSDDLPYGAYATPVADGSWLLVEDRAGNRSEILLR